MRGLLPAVLTLLAGCASAPPAEPDVLVKEVEYREGGAVFRGHLAVPARASAADPRPGVVVVHEWWGLGEHPRRAAEALARLGYVALAVDMYGEGRVTTDPKQAGAWAGEVRGDPAMAIRRLRAGLDVLHAMAEVDSSRMACIGYCFGGTVSLEAAWSGLPLRAVVSFHGNLTTPKPDQVPRIKASILVCHGADDPFVPPEAVEAFQQSMKENRLDWQFASFGGAVHSFTNPDADGSFNAGAKYDPLAAARAWALMEDFLAERFR